MKNPLALTIVGLFALGLAAGTIDAAMNQSAAQTAEVKSLDLQKGSFHKQHNQTLKLPCATCHSPSSQDTLFLRKDEPLPAGMPGRVDRTVCLSCHKAPAKPTWYGAAPR
jgi:hypothetical protein